MAFGEVGQASSQAPQPSYSSGNIFGGKPGWFGGLKRYQDTHGTLAANDLKSVLDEKK